jgi:hypothetical protein
MLTDRWQHVSECLICCHVLKWNVSESVAGSVKNVLGVFVNWPETAVGCVISVSLSVHISWFVSEGSFVKLYFGDFMKIR